MRPITHDERLTLLAAFEWHGASLDDLLRDHDAEVWTNGAEALKLYLVSRSLARCLPAGQLEPASLGLPIGELDGDRLRLGLEGAFELSRRTRQRRVILKPKAAQLFLYGRDILGEGIKDADKSMSIGMTAFVANERGEGLGIARVLQKLPGKGRALEPIIDRGWYLRQGD